MSGCVKCDVAWRILYRVVDMKRHRYLPHTHASPHASRQRHKLLKLVPSDVL